MDCTKQEFSTIDKNKSDKTFLRINTIIIYTPFTVAKIWKLPKNPLTDDWIKKMWCVCVYIHIHTQWNIILSNKKVKFCHF